MKHFIFVEEPGWQDGKRFRAGWIWCGACEGGCREEESKGSSRLFCLG
ncbi:MAG: hypothetical protein R3B47_10615 [Bacteroidia bacterium]